MFFELACSKWEGEGVVVQSSLNLLGTGHLLQGGGLQNGKLAGPKLFAPPPIRTG